MSGSANRAKAHGRFADALKRERVRLSSSPTNPSKTRRTGTRSGVNKIGLPGEPAAAPGLSPSQLRRRSQGRGYELTPAERALLAGVWSQICRSAHYRQSGCCKPTRRIC